MTSVTRKAVLSMRSIAEGDQFDTIRILYRELQSSSQM